MPRWRWFSALHFFWCSDSWLQPFWFLSPYRKCFVCSGWGPGPWPCTARMLGWAGMQEPTCFAPEQPKDWWWEWLSGCFNEEHPNWSKCGNIKFPASSHCYYWEAWPSGLIPAQDRERGLCNPRSYTWEPRYPHSFRFVRHSGEASTSNITSGILWNYPVRQSDILIGTEFWWLWCQNFNSIK